MGSGAPAAEQLGARRARTGVSLFLFSELLALFSLLCAEAVRRLRAAPAWHPSPWAAAGLTLLLVAGWMLAQAASEGGARGRLLGGASAAGVAFIAGQCWLDTRGWAAAAGLAVALSAFHLLHVLAAVLLAARKRPTPGWREGLASLWTFLAVAQLMIFTLAELL